MHRLAQPPPGLGFETDDRAQLGPAAAAGVGAVERGAADRAAFHRSGLQIEDQILQLLAGFGQTAVIANRPGIADRFDQVDQLRAILLAGIVQLGLGPRDQGLDVEGIV